MTRAVCAFPWDNNICLQLKAAIIILFCGAAHFQLDAVRLQFITASPGGRTVAVQFSFP